MKLICLIFSFSETRKCNGTDHRCNSGRCIPRSWVCDGENDCGDDFEESAENGCLESFKCLTTHFQCLNGECIPQEFYCDSFDDCGDKSDEPFTCERICSSDEFSCKNGKCVPLDWTCNGVNECGDNSDEEASNCGKQI